MTRSSKYGDKPRRQSRRLKGLSAIYEVGDAKVCKAYPIQQHIDRGSDANVNKQTKVEMADPEDIKFCNQQENTTVASEYDSDELFIIDITLKDLKEGCRPKKRKRLKSFAQNSDVRNHKTLEPSQMLESLQGIEPIQEESDLLEPIITLRQKTRKLSTANIKKKKHVDALDASRCQEDVLAESPCLTSDPAQVASRCSAVAIELPVAEGRSIDIAEITNSAEDVGMKIKKHLSEADTSSVSLPLERDLRIGTHVPNLCAYAKSEILDSSSDCQNSDDGLPNSRLNFQSHGSSLCRSFTELLQKCSRTGSQSNDLSFFMVQKCNNPLTERKDEEICLQPKPGKKTDFHIKNPPYHNIKSEIMENDYPMQNHSSSNADSTDYIGTPSYSVDSSVDQFQGVDEDVLDNANCTSSLCCINEVSLELGESINNYLPKSEFDECGIKVSSVSNHESLKLLSSGSKDDSCTHQPVSTSMEPVPASYSCTEIENHAMSLEENFYESRMNQIDISPNGHSNGRMEKQDDCSSHLVNGCTLDDIDNRSHDIPICCQKKEAATNKDLLSEQVYGLEEIFLSSTERHSCYDLVDNGVDRNLDRDHKENTSNHTEEPLCSSLLPHTCFGAVTAVDDSHATAVSCATNFSSEVEEDLLESRPKQVNLSSDLSEIKKSLYLRKLHFQSSRTPQFTGTPSELLSIDVNLVKAADDSSSLLTEENTFPGSKKPITKAKRVKTAGKRPSEFEQSSILNHTPKKLSHRKTWQIISPTSQEKLCQAISDIYLNDTSQGPDKKESETSSPEMIKKSRSCMNGLLSPTKKVTVKSQNTSNSIACSCSKSSSASLHIEKAIEFSQQQMNDIEKLAMQLLKGLNSMKSVVEETLSLEFCSSLSSKFTADEIRATAENAAELERTTKKWLYIMTKDCTRFCKIMRSAANDSALPANGAHKERRKITFADEVGGPLCHVKVFDRH